MTQPRTSERPWFVNIWRPPATVDEIRPSMGQTVFDLVRHSGSEMADNALGQGARSSRFPPLRRLTHVL